jgi:hypothetical protein
MAKSRKNSTSSAKKQEEKVASEAVNKTTNNQKAANKPKENKQQEVKMNENNPQEPEVKDNEVAEQNNEVVEEVKPEVKEVNTNTVGYIRKIIKESKSLEELVDKAEKNDLLKTIAARIKRYINNIRRKNNPDDVVSEHYNMYNLFKEILGDKNYNNFKIKYEFLSRCFILGKNDVFNPINMSKYDYLWKWSKKTHKEYHMLVELISSLADPKTRRNTLKQVDFNKSFINFPEQMRENLNKYYTMGQ